MDDEIKNYLDGVVGIVEATNFEMNCLREKEIQFKHPWDSEMYRGGYGPTVGYLNTNPVCISIQAAKVRECKLIFWHAMSQFVDYGMIEKWFADNLPPTAFKKHDGRVNKTDANNFSNIFPHVYYYKTEDGKHYKIDADNHKVFLYDESGKCLAEYKKNSQDGTLRRLPVMDGNDSYHALTKYQMDQAELRTLQSENNDGMLMRYIKTALNIK